MKPWLSVIGLGEDGLDGVSPAARALVNAAQVLVGGKRHLAMIPDGGAERLGWRLPIEDTVADIVARRGKRVVVLATGDPMSYGIGVTLARHVPMQEMTVIPAPGAFSLACARLGWPLAAVATLTLHGRPLELMHLHLAPGARLLILSHDGATPAAVARRLTERGYGPSRVTVFEHMGGPAERRRDGTAASWPEARCADFNTIAVDCRAAPGTPLRSLVPGLPDAAFAHDGQITKRELRAVTLAKLAPHVGARLWDVGAGCGSVAVEWLRAAPEAAADAVERDPGRCDLIARNAAELGVPRLNVVPGTAPEALAGLPAPDAVFIGGGITAAGLVDTCWRALVPGGRLVANVVTVEGEAALAELRRRRGGALTRIAVSRAEPLGPHQGWRPLMPVTQFAAVKQESEVRNQKRRQSHARMRNRHTDF